jgi:RNA polymerase sigma-70 factor (ECF subfamily)
LSAFLIGEESAEVPEPVARESAEAWSCGWPQTPLEFEALVDAYLDRLVRYATRRLGNVHDAEDVVQEVFIRAYAERVKYRAVARTGPYLYRMVVNACTDSLRKRRGCAASLEDIGPEEPCSNEKNPSEAAAMNEETRRVENLLRLLPEDQAEAIRLRVFGELRLREIAETLGCPVDTVSSRLRYGFKKLRQIVSGKRG